MKPKPVLMSSPQQHQRTIGFGAPDYGYAVAADKFARMFGERGIAVRRVETPEQLKDPLAQRLMGLDASEHLHLMFRPPQQLRVIPGAYNVSWFAWEYDRLKHDAPAHESIHHDHARMLRACDEVWTPCAYTRRVLHAHGIERVHVVPAPTPVPAPQRKPAPAALGDLAMREAIPLVSMSAVDEGAFRRIAREHATTLGAQPRLTAAMAAGRVFVTVCDPTERRKNLPTLIDGFLMATRGLEDAVLLVKLVGGAEFEPPFAYLFHQIRPALGEPHCLHEESVILFAGPLTDPEMERLYVLADFYLCASLAEGQGMALLEAMAQGCIPVAPANTAMADYIDVDNAVPIAGKTYSGLVSGLAGDVAQRRLELSLSDRNQVAAAVRAALALDADARTARARGAQETVRRGYSEEAVLANLTARLKATRAEVTPAASRLRPSWWR